MTDDTQMTPAEPTPEEPMPETPAEPEAPVPQVPETAAEPSMAPEAPRPPEVPGEAMPEYAPPPPPPPPPGAEYAQQAPYAPPQPCPKSKVWAGVLGIIVGSLGVHKFYLGYTTEGLIMLAVTVFGWIFTAGVASGAMSVIGLIEGIIYLTKSDQEFCDIYVYNKKGWF